MQFMILSRNLRQPRTKQPNLELNPPCTSSCSIDPTDMVAEGSSPANRMPSSQNCKVLVSQSHASKPNFV
jgi:hypothetical protein